MDEQEALVEDLRRLAIGEEHEMGDTASEEGAVSMEVVEEIHGNPEIHEKIQGDETVYQSLQTECHADQLLYPGPTEGYPSRFHWKKLANSKKFTNKSWRKQRRHPCHSCKMSFYNNFQLRVHMRNHTKISPYRLGIRPFDVV
uniref:C2H2-type domain-containing protein n=1 Tax=Anopheles dirus TaxID=7168 RepID=A0A182NGS8_9DIPT